MSEGYTLNFTAEEREKILKFDNENSGIDIHCPEEVTIPPMEKVVVNLKIKCQLKKGEKNSAFWLMPRSSLATKTPLILCNSMGLIDSGYRGNLQAVVFNLSHNPFTIQKLDRLFQIVNPDLLPFTSVNKVEVLEESERGEGGFGSTGKN